MLPTRMTAFLIFLLVLLAAVPTLLVYEGQTEIWVCRRDGRAPALLRRATLRAGWASTRTGDPEYPRVASIADLAITDLERRCREARAMCDRGEARLAGRDGLLDTVGAGENDGGAWSIPVKNGFLVSASTSVRLPIA